MKTMDKKNDQFWDSEKVISMVESSDKIATRTAIVTKDGKQFVDIRKFTRTPEGYTQHTPKGISIPVEDITKVADSLFVVMKELKKADRDIKHDEKAKAEAPKAADKVVKIKQRWSAEQRRSRAVSK